ncbi:MAG TPA: ABC transporter ATP-binding protein [Clostridiaceae bacterium]|nr:ABC transporter ATP-binding protein [Clostridiaceae bacterium]
MDVIEIMDLTKSYDNKLNAVDSISLNIGKGEIFGFLGPNGSGKTTTVRLLNGILTPTSGNARVLGMDIGTKQAEINRLSGVMTETALMYENLSGMENLLFFGRMHGMSEVDVKERSTRLFESLELSDSADKKVKAYSTGMKRRLSIARALLHRPEVLFLDEPTAGLDPESALNVTKLIRQLSLESGVTVFLCTHQLKYAEEICTSYGFIHKGRILGAGTFDELLAKKNSRKYLEVRGKDIPELPDIDKRMDDGIRVAITSDLDASLILAKIIREGGEVYEAKQVHWDLEDLYFSFQKEVQS